MSNTVYLTLLWAILGVGLVSGGAYLVLYQAWRLRRWRSPVVRDASGWVVVLWLYFAWSGWRLLSATLAGAPANPAPTGVRVSILALGVLLDGAFVARLRNYLRTMADERRNPTRVCGCCGGAGVVPVGGAVRHRDP